MTLALFLTGLLLFAVAAVALVRAALTERWDGSKRSAILAALGWALFVAGVICWLGAIWTGAL